MKELNSVVGSFPETIFSTMSRLARENDAVNLGQGFPDFEGPAWLRELYGQSILTGPNSVNQYAPDAGILSLRTSLSDLYKRLYELEYSPDQVTVTTGCTEGIFCSILSIVNPGDEVVLFEPYYDSYEATVRLAGGIPKFVTLKYPDFSFSAEELAETISDKTKLIVLNTPHNPTGKVFDDSELTLIANCAKENDLYVISDEVYEHLTFDNTKHRSIASLPGMKDRTIVLSSLGKTFGFTGWKIGWALASDALTKSLRLTKQYTTFCTNHPLQVASVKALERIDEYLVDFKKTYLSKRDYFLSGLASTGLEFNKPAGTYFVMAKIPKGYDNDIDFCKKMIVEAKTAAIPPSGFYTKSNEGEQLVRFCFAKADETLDLALNRLQQWLK